MENAPAIRQSNIVPCIPNDHEMTVFNVMAKQAVESKMYRGIGDQAGVMMIMLSARELGIPPMQALNGGLSIIQGKVEISAKMMGAMIRKAGHDFVPKEHTDTKCVMWGKRGDNGRELEVSFTLEEAKTAGIFKAGGGWTKWPKDMLFARALSRIGRQLFGDVVGMGYVEGEIKPKEMEYSNNEEVIVEQEVEIVPSEEELLDKYLNLFDRDERLSAVEYLKVVMEVFSWTRSQTIMEFLKDEKKLFQKFNVWKEKLKKSEPL